MPPITTVARGRWTSAPVPVAKAIGDLKIRGVFMRTEYKRMYAEGEAAVYTLDSSSDQELVATLRQHDSVFIKRNHWHMLCNETDKPLKLIEIQYGENCIEEDIERK